jgi:NAD(P)-dependent dehydrogenase (short-subunit alcohol dehydrogenase family)
MTLSGKTVLVTGGTGSFGRSFAHAALDNYEARTVIVCGRDELTQHDVGVSCGDARRRRLAPRRAPAAYWDVPRRGHMPRWRPQRGCLRVLGVLF